jgi:hypothetical protein
MQRILTRMHDPSLHLLISLLATHTESTPSLRPIKEYSYKGIEMNQDDADKKKSPSSPTKTAKAEKTPNEKEQSIQGTGKHTTIISGILALPFNIYCDQFLRYLESNGLSYMGKMITEKKINTALELYALDYPEHQKRANLFKQKCLELEKGPGKRKLSEKYVPSDSDSDSGSGSSKETRKPRIPTSAKVFVKDLPSWCSKYPFERPNPHRTNHRAVTAANRSQEAAKARAGPKSSSPPFLISACH